MHGACRWNDLDYGVCSAKGGPEGVGVNADLLLIRNDYDHYQIIILLSYHIMNIIIL